MISRSFFFYQRSFFAPAAGATVSAAAPPAVRRQTSSNNPPTQSLAVLDQLEFSGLGPGRGPVLAVPLALVLALGVVVEMQNHSMPITHRHEYIYDILSQMR